MISRWSQAWLGFGLVVAIFCVPLFVGLGETDMRNDESIYSYSVERILETGEWLTPRAIPGDGPFYEKPPLKFWLTAAGMRAGLLPRDERGMRLLDALLGAIAFGYIYWLGVELGGAACGIVALLVLFTLDPIVFDHGLRSNNMEAAVVLGYCGGVFHFNRWRASRTRPAARAHAFAVAAYFTLAFMTKFVAALFLPVVCVAALAWVPEDRRRQFGRWREWALPVMATVAAIVPWFAYETFQGGRDFWNVIFGAHILTRFTSSLDPSHLHPWYFYVLQTWKELGYSHSQFIAAAGLAVLLAAAFWRSTFLVRLIVVWGILPVVAISLGTSKLIHYAFPFWPPLGLGAGYAFSEAARLFDRWIGPPVVAWFTRAAPGWTGRSSGARRFRALLIGIAAVSIFVAAWTAIIGPVTITAGGHRLFRNGTVLRPVVFAAVVATVGGYTATVTRMVGILILSLLLPFRTYMDEMHKLSRVDHPLRSLRDCMLGPAAAAGGAGAGVFAASPDELAHPYYFYLRKTGPWTEATAFSPADVLVHVDARGRQTPVIVAARDYRTLLAAAASRDPRMRDGWPALDDQALMRFQQVLRAGVEPERPVVVLLPGPFQVCRDPMIAAAARPAAGVAIGGHSP